MRPYIYRAADDGGAGLSEENKAMPYSPSKPCIHPGCGVLVLTGSRCPAHDKGPTAKRVYDLTSRLNNPALAHAKRFRDSKHWQRFRSYFRAQHPLCCDPFKLHAALPAFTASIHHVIPLHQRMDLGLTESNCRPLCTRCHNRVEGMERRGESTAELFGPTPPSTPGGTSKVSSP